jgi:hypothetical protein
VDLQKLNSLKSIFQIYAGICVMVGCFHLIGIFYPINSSPEWRHALFVGINLFCVYGFLRRPRFFIYFFCLLFVQQLYSHGGAAVAIWNKQRAISWVDFGVISFISVALILLFKERRKGSTNG